MKNLLLILMVMLISACSYSNVGKVDYRKTIKTNTKYEQKVSGDKCDCIEDKSFLKLSNKDKAFDISDTLKFTPKLDKVSLHLKTAYIKDFAELGTKSADGDDTFNTNEKGEKVVVANAFELDANNTKKLSFSDLKQGRVVYYDNDVLEGQTLNFNNMPIYGPSTYKGNPFAFRISILELDNKDAYSKKIINTLADLGGKAYPQASPILALLNNLGESFISADNTDYEFRYSMYLDGKSGLSKAVNHTVLEVGYYVFIKKHKRNEKIDWDNIYLNSNDNLLYKNNKLYKGGTYLIVEINKNISDTDINLDSDNLLALQNELSSLAKIDLGDSSKIQAKFEAYSINKSQKTNFNTANNLLNDLIFNKKLNANLKKLKASKFIKLISSSLDNQANVIANGKISAKQIDLLIERIIVYSNQDYFEFSKENFKALENKSDLNGEVIFDALLNLNPDPIKKQ